MRQLEAKEASSFSEEKEAKRLLALRIAEALRTASWFNAGRARAYGRLLAVAMTIILLGMAARLAATAAADPKGRPAVSDFVAFWAGGKLAANGPALDAYSNPKITAAEAREVQLPVASYLPFVYPPLFLFLCVPLASIPYLPALTLFSLAGLLGFGLAARRILPAGAPLLPCLLFPGAVMNAVIGQNGWISATCYAIAVPLLDKRPFLAGACLGCLAFKPHLAAALPFALLPARRWRVVLGGATSSVGLSLAAWAVFGTAAWRAFLHAPAIEMAQLASQPTLRNKLASVYDGLLQLGLPNAAALPAQIAVALLALGWLVSFTRQRPGAPIEMAAAIAATLLCSPHLADYDLVCLGVPLAVLFAAAQDTGFHPWEKIALTALYLMPLGARWCGVNLHVPLVPECAVLLCLLLNWRGTAEAQHAAA